MKKNSEHLDKIYSYLSLRKAVGWIGILLPLALPLGAKVIFGEDSIRHNISVYYYSGMRDVLVGALCSIALFLFFYKGYDKWDNRAANLAGVFALGIAFFPTVPDGPYNTTATIHFFCAATFFAILAIMSLYFFTRSKPEPTRQKLIRNKIYIICGLVMVASAGAVPLFLLFLRQKWPDSTFVFWAETVALMAFGVSWLTKGGTIYPDIKSRLAGKKYDNKPG